MDSTTRTAAIIRCHRAESLHAKESGKPFPIMIVTSDMIMFHSDHIAFRCPSSELDPAKPITPNSRSEVLTAKLMAYLDRVTVSGSRVSIPSVAELRRLRAKSGDSFPSIDFFGNTYRLIDLIYACRVLGADSDTENWTISPKGTLVLRKYGSIAAVKPLK